MHNLSLIDTLKALRFKSISAAELMQHTLHRINGVGKSLQLIVDVDETAALNAAKHADNQLSQGQPLGPLHGIPLAHKDMFYRKGRISGCGSSILKTTVAKTTATVLSRLDHAGAIDTARLSMVEFALGVTGHNDVAQTALNPWDPARIPGGSSSGSAAAVSSNIIPAALGSDTGGSVRIPAFCCGVVGMKPTWGRISRYGAMPLSPSLDTIGPLTRTVTDNALIFQTIAGHDENDITSSKINVSDCLNNINKGVHGLSIGVPETYFFDDLAPDVMARIEQAINVYQQLGATIVSVKMPKHIQDSNALNSLIIACEGAALHAPWLKSRSDDYGPQTFGRLLTGSLTPATQYLQALSLREPILRDFSNLVFEHCDVMIAPVLKTETPTIKDTDFGDKPGFSDFVRDLGFATRPFNYLGLPALSIPCGLTNKGLPMGFQLIARPFNEEILYQIGRAYERETMTTDLRPPNHQ